MNKDEIIKSLTSQAQKKFPEFIGIQPQIKWNTKSEKDAICTLTFHTTMATNTGKSLYRRMKVVGNADGKIIKISSSK